MRIWLWISVFTLIVAGLSCHRILIMLPFGSRSHKNVFDPVAEELVKRGHLVTLMSPIKETKEKEGITNVYLESVADIMVNRKMNFFQGTVGDPSFMNSLFNAMFEMCNATYMQPEVADIVKNPRASQGSPKYDLLVVDAVFNEMVLPLAHHMGIPAVYISPSGMFPYQAWSLNIPYPFSYVPVGFGTATSPMTFLERTSNAFSFMAFTLIRNFYLFRHLDEIIAGFLPGTPPLLQLESGVSFMMTNTHPALNPIAPSMPYSLEVGCLHCKPAKKLPKDLEDYLDGAGKDGVIYFSLGSVTQGKSMPLEMREKVIAAFSKMPQKILWKYENEIEGLPKNIKLISWAPQQDLLAHPQLRLFITHSGGLSTQEAAYHGCPILGFPLSADQWGNIANAKKAGYAEFLDWRIFTSDDFYKLVQTMLSETRYKENAVRVSALLKDQLDLPVQRAAYWIAYVIRHKGAPHLKSGAENLNFFQYFLLDIAAVLVFLGFNLFLLMCFVIHRLMKYFGKTSNKSATAISPTGDPKENQPKTKPKKSKQNKTKQS